MSWNVYRTKSTGRAVCKICDCLIIRGKEMIVFEGYRESGRVHGSKRACTEAVKLVAMDKIVRAQPGG